MKMLWAGTQESLELYLKKESEPRPTIEATGADIKAYNNSLNPFEDEAYEDQPISPLLTVTNGVGIIAISGLLVAEDSWFNEYMGQVSYSAVQRAVLVAGARTDVDTILLDITSPGGQVTGARETMLLIKAVGEYKPVISFSEMAASSAYWLASATQKRYIAATGVGGSIGVVARHVEYSKMNEKDGITETILRAGQYKQLMNSSEPLTDAAVAETMRLLDESYRVFVQDISNNLDVPYAQIDNVAQGREYLGQQAVDAGLFHKVSDFQEVLAALVITEEEGGSIVKGKSLTYSMASAFAASAAAAGTEIEGTPAVEGEGAEGVELNAEGTPEGNSEPTKEEQLELDFQASVALVAERDAALEEKITELAASTEALETAQGIIDQFKTIVVQAVGNISVALNVENTLGAEADAATILAAYTEKSKLFADQFPAGGVAAVEDSEGDSVEAPLVSRFDIARSKQSAIRKKG